MAYPKGDGTHDYDHQHSAMFDRIMTQWFLPQFSEDIEFLGETVTVCEPGKHGLIAQLMSGWEYRVGIVFTPYIYLRPKGKKKPDFSLMRGELITDKASRVEPEVLYRAKDIAKHLGLYPKCVPEDEQVPPTIFYPSVVGTLDRYVIRLYPYTQLEYLREADVRQKAGELAHIISELYSTEGQLG